MTVQGVDRGSLAVRRALRMLALAAWLAAAALVIRQIVADPPDRILLHLLAVPVHFFLACLLADWCSGLVHFAADTFGSRRTPILGPMFVEPFRHHHIEPTAITEHNVLDTNGNTAVPAMFPLLFVLMLPAGGAAWAWHASVFVVFLCSLGLLTNQIHKWAHDEAPPAAIARLQGIGLIISPERHARHHTAPFESHYCITSGWAEPLMAWAGPLARRRRERADPSRSAPAQHGSAREGARAERTSW